jgi:protein-S-isoprenylcysteine O-methyltransferase Ste14
MLLARALMGFIFLFLVIATVLFGLLGTLHDGPAWAMLAMFFGCAGIITVWLWFRDKALLERRVKAGPGSEPDPMQNVVQAVAGLVFLATFAVPGLDRRFGWSHAPLAVSLAGDGMIAIGFLIVFLTFRENTFTAGTIEVAEGQHVIDSGPYAVVRHPMYAGALVMIAGIPLALGSWWACSRPSCWSRSSCGDCCARRPFSPQTSLATTPIAAAYAIGWRRFSGSRGDGP